MKWHKTYTEQSKSNVLKIIFYGVTHSLIGELLSFLLNLQLGSYFVTLETAMDDTPRLSLRFGEKLNNKIFNNKQDLI